MSTVPEPGPLVIDPADSPHPPEHSIPVEADPAPKGAKKKGIGIAAWLCIAWLAIISLSALLAPILPINDPAEEVTQKRLAPFQPGRSTSTARAPSRSARSH